MTLRRSFLAGLAAALAFVATPSAKAASLQAVSGWGISGLPSDVSMYIYVPDKVVAKSSNFDLGPLLRGHCFGRVWSGADGRHRQGGRPVWLHHGRPQQWAMLGHRVRQDAQARRRRR